MSPQGSPEKPLYSKQHQQPARSAQATDLYMIVADEGWRSWIPCTDMYGWAADQLIRILKECGAKWPR